MLLLLTYLRRNNAQATLMEIQTEYAYHPLQLLSLSYSEIKFVRNVVSMIMVQYKIIGILSKKL